MANQGPILSLISNETTTHVPEIQLAQPSDLARLLNIRNYFFPRMSDYPQNAMMVITSLDAFEKKVLECSENYYKKWDKYLLCYETIVANMREKVSHQSINIPAELLHNPIDLMNRQLTIMKKI